MMTNENTHQKLNQNILTIYGLYGVAAIFQFHAWLSILGLFLIMAGLVLNYTCRKIATDTVYQSHVTWLLKTFWIGTGVMLPIFTVFCVAMIWQFSDISAMKNAIMSGSITTEAQFTALFEDYMRANALFLSAIMLPTFGYFMAWWLGRCWFGFQKARAEQPIDHPTRVFAIKA